MKTINFKIGSEIIHFKVPLHAEVFSMDDPIPLKDPTAAIAEALIHSIGSPGLEELIKDKLAEKKEARAVVVISDNTRPVPYKGETGILWPVVKKLLDHGFTKDRILILVATGTHHPLNEEELHAILDPRIFEAGIPVCNHDCHDQTRLAYLGESRHGAKIVVNRDYLAADLKILTGLVESHFMAGFSGGRKSICPGLIGEESTYVFHGANMLASPMASDLSLNGNPCHEEALEIAQKVGTDYIINVTLDRNFKLTGVFAGDLIKAHEQAVNRVKQYTGLPIKQEFDIVVTYAGYVGINHYQAAKVGVNAANILKTGGSLIVVANNTDADPVGSPNYRTMIHLLKMNGAEEFNRLLLSPDWSFVPEQWQVQMWTRLFNKIPPTNFIYYSPQLTADDYRILPGQDGNCYLPEEERYHGTFITISKVIESALQNQLAGFYQQNQHEARIAILADGPYGVPVKVS